MQAQTEKGKNDALFCYQTGEEQHPVHFRKIGNFAFRDCTSLINLKILMVENQLMN